MAQLKKCPNGSRHFQFEMKQYSHVGLYLHTLFIEGFACKKEGYVDADIDSVKLNNEEIKPLLEINGGMLLIDQEATTYAKQMFKIKLRVAA